MSFVGIPQACESIAIDLVVLAGKLRVYGQAIRQNDATKSESERVARALSKKAKSNLEEFLELLPQESTEKSTKSNSKRTK